MRRWLFVPLLIWAAASHAAVTAIVTPPGGDNTEVQFNNSRRFGGDPDFTFNGTTVTATVGSIGTLSVTGNSSFNGPRPWRDIMSYGASCNGSASDSSAIQAAHDASSNGDVIFIPPSTSGCVVTTTITVTKQISFVGASAHGSLLISSADRVMFDIDTSASDLYYIRFKNLEMVNSSSGSISTAVRVSGPNGLKYSAFENLSVRGFQYAFSIVNTGSTDWTTFSNIDVHGEPSSPSWYGIYRTAVGTGMTVVNSQLITSTSAIYVRGSNFGDYNITGNQLFANGPSHLMFFESTSPYTYANQISIVGNKFDGDQTNSPIQFIRVNASIVEGNALAMGDVVVDEDSNSTDNIIQVGYGVGTQWDRDTVINDHPTTNRSGFGTITPLAKVHIRPTTDYNLLISSAISVTGSMVLSAVNDANSNNIPFEFRASSHVFLNGNVGINSTNPQKKLHIVGTDGAVASFPTLAARDFLVVENNHRANIALVSSSTLTGSLGYYANGGSAAAGYLTYDHSLSQMQVAANNVLTLTISSHTSNFVSGNLGVGASVPTTKLVLSSGIFTTDGTTAYHTFAMNTTTPTAVSGQASIWAVNVGGSAEMKVIDGAGNITQISPHDPVTGAWIFRSYNVNTGRSVRVDMERFIKAVEKLTEEVFWEEAYDEVPKAKHRQRKWNKSVVK